MHIILLSTKPSLDYLVYSARRAKLGRVKIHTDLYYYLVYIEVMEKFGVNLVTSENVYYYPA